MWILKKASFLFLLLLFVAGPAFGEVTPLEVGKPLTQEQMNLIQQCTKILLTKSPELREILSGIKDISTISEQKAKSLNQSLTSADQGLQTSEQKLEIVDQSLARASESPEILNEIAELLGILPNELEILLPNMKQRVESLLDSAASKQQEINLLKADVEFWQTATWAGAGTTVICIILAIVGFSI